VTYGTKNIQQLVGSGGIIPEPGRLVHFACAGLFLGNFSDLSSLLKVEELTAYKLLDIFM